MLSDPLISAAIALAEHTFSDRSDPAAWLRERARLIQRYKAERDKDLQPPAPDTEPARADEDELRSHLVPANPMDPLYSQGGCRP